MNTRTIVQRICADMRSKTLLMQLSSRNIRYLLHWNLAAVFLQLIASFYLFYFFFFFFHGVHICIGQRNCQSTRSSRAKGPSRWPSTWCPRCWGPWCAAGAPASTSCPSNWRRMPACCTARRRGPCRGNNCLPFSQLPKVIIKKNVNSSIKFPKISYVINN